MCHNVRNTIEFYLSMFAVGPEDGEKSLLNEATEASSSLYISSCTAFIRKLSVIWYVLKPGWSDLVCSSRFQNKFDRNGL